MTDKEFLELLMLYKAGKVPVVSVGMALAKNQFSHEYVALANNILVSQKAQRQIDTPEPSSHHGTEMVLELRTQVAL